MMRISSNLIENNKACWRGCFGSNLFVQSWTKELNPKHPQAILGRLVFELRLKASSKWLSQVNRGNAPGDDQGGVCRPRGQVVLLSAQRTFVGALIFTTTPPRESVCLRPRLKNKFNSFVPKSTELHCRNASEEWGAHRKKNNFWQRFFEFTWCTEWWRVGP